MGKQRIDPSKYELKLDPSQEKKFQEWFEKQHNEGKIGEGDYKFYKEHGYGYDYDFRMAFEHGKTPVKKEDGGHWDDMGKKPNHETFSENSAYHGQNGHYGGRWDGDKFTPYDKIEHIEIPDKRKVDSITGKPITDKNNQSVVAEKEMVMNIIKSAKEKGIDPNIPLAIAFQETGFGQSGGLMGDITKYRKNPLHNNINKDATLDESMDFLKQKMADAKKRLGKKSDEEVIQSWNGYGKIMVDPETEQAGEKPSFYGLDLTKQPMVGFSRGIDFNKTPIYGKKVVDLRDNVIKTNPDIQSMIRQVYGGDPIHATQDHINEAMQKTGHTDPQEFYKWFNATKGKTIVPIND